MLCRHPLLKDITGWCSDKINLIIVSNSPAFFCWADAYMLRRSCLISAQANHRMRHTVTQINQLIHAPSICMISNTLRSTTHLPSDVWWGYQISSLYTSWYNRAQSNSPSKDM
jgi:hypothetical protein